MRTIIALALALAASAASADELADAHKLALQGRDSYWNCLAREYQRDGSKSMSAQAFTADIASVCPSERQNFRVTLMDYLSMQNPDAEASANLTTANRAIELAQKDIVTAFVHRKGAN
jgi:murein L,D-transpeptidase YcbB/YkuD